MRLGLTVMSMYYSLLSLFLAKDRRRYSHYFSHSTLATYLIVGEAKVVTSCINSTKVTSGAPQNHRPMVRAPSRPDDASQKVSRATSSPSQSVLHSLVSTVIANTRPDKMQPTRALLGRRSVWKGKCPPPLLPPSRNKRLTLFAPRTKHRPVTSTPLQSLHPNCLCPGAACATMIHSH